MSAPTSVIRARSRVVPMTFTEKPSHSNGNLARSDSARTQRRLDEHVGATTPQRAQGAETRPVFKAVCGQHRVGLGEYAFGMARPGPIGTFSVYPPIDPDRTIAGPTPCAHDDLHRYPTVFADDQPRM